MLRALSTRRSHNKYEKLVDNTESSSAGLILKRSKTLPVRFFGSASKRGQKVSVEVELKLPSLPAVKPAMKVNKSHPLFSLFDRRRQNKRTTSRPEFARYIEYVKEGRGSLYYK
ncbi:unnamed protein product [Linum tenue]|uniref:Uncharacterized protein n=1 Tax=Linum tenue TaxID=586396 RepID=A0AAV0I597_9ROSI|nr:unnamed protein product [Linum tenue]